MNKLEKIGYKANECSTFLSSAMKSLTRGQLDIDHLDAYFKKGPTKWVEAEILVPVPLLINVVGIQQRSINKIVEELPEIIQDNRWRFDNLLEHLIPFVCFNSTFGKEVHYSITSKGLEERSYNSIVSEKHIPIPVPDWLDINDLDIYHALSTANHKIFTKRFNPELLKNNPKYGSFYKPEQHLLVKKYVEEIRNEEPLRAQELEELL